MENKNIHAVDIDEIKSPYLQDDDCIDRYLKTIERDGYQVIRTESEMTFKKDGATTTIRFKNFPQLERNIRLFMRDLPQPKEE
jgi:hypothetical protein